DYEYSEADEDLEDAWFDIEDEFRIRYPTLTDGDVTVEPGRFQNTLDRMGQRLNRTLEEIRQEIESWNYSIGYVRDALPLSVRSILLILVHEIIKRISCPFNFCIREMPCIAFRIAKPVW